MQDARGHQPARTRLEPVGHSQIKDAVVPFIPPFKAIAHISAGCVRRHPKEGEREIVDRGIKLGWEVVRLGLALSAQRAHIFGALVQVVRYRTHVVEEFAEDRPAPVLAVDIRTNDSLTLKCNRVAQKEETAVSIVYVAETLVRRRRGAVVGGHG